MQVLDSEPVSREEFFAALEKLDNRAKVNHDYIAGEFAYMRKSFEEFAYMRRSFEEIFSRLEEQDKRFDKIDKTLIALKELIIQNGSSDK